MAQIMCEWCREYKEEDEGLPVGESSRWVCFECGESRLGDLAEMYTKGLERIPTTLSSEKVREIYRKTYIPAVLAGECPNCLDFAVTLASIREKIDLELAEIADEEGLVAYELAEKLQAIDNLIGAVMPRDLDSWNKCPDCGIRAFAHVNEKADEDEECPYPSGSNIFECGAITYRGRILEPCQKDKKGDPDAYHKSGVLFNYPELLMDWNPGGKPEPKVDMIKLRDELGILEEEELFVCMPKEFGGEWRTPPGQTLLKVRRVCSQPDHTINECPSRLPPVDPHFGTYEFISYADWMKNTRRGHE